MSMGTETPPIPDGLRWEVGVCVPCGTTQDVTAVPAIGRHTILIVCGLHYWRYARRFHKTIQLRPWYGLLVRQRGRSPSI